MKKLIKILLTMMTIAVVANVFYIGKEFKNFKETEKNFIIGIMEMEIEFWSFGSFFLFLI